MRENDPLDRNEAPYQVSDTRLGIFVLALVAFWTVATAYSVHPLLPANPIHLPLEENNFLIRLLPQGWAFFTRDPKSLDSHAFVRSPDAFWTPVPGPPRWWPYTPTFSRRWKIPAVEIGLILDGLYDPQWQPCQDRPTDCLDSAPVVTPVENIRSRPVLCGEVGIVRQPPVPWAWSQTSDETIMPSDVLRLQVSCHE